MSGLQQLSATVTAANSPEVAGSDLTYVVVVAVIALGALAVAAGLVRQVLAADEGTDTMKRIAGAVQEGASAYLTRQFRTLSGFAVGVFFLLMLLPADTMNERIGRSLFFLVGAVFSAVTGYTGMWLAVRSNVRVAAAARAGHGPEGSHIA
ncbi:MAG: sodium-translocating pyrophosphatase, partial [Streptomycetaceae bacterium]|nr:sodium-translocating pyrophosphatase [Streptomycetaceae bacterium]